MSSTVPTVAFAFMSPEAIGVFLQLAGYQVSIFDGSDASLALRPDKPGKNIVLLPNFSKRNLLAPHAPHIDGLVLMTNGRHEDIIDLDVPILDGVVDGDGLRKDRERTPHYYTKKIAEAAVPLLLETPSALPTKAAEPKEIVPSTLDHWFDEIDGIFPDGCVFDRDVEYPVCQYLTGQLSREDLKGAMKVLVQRGADKATLQGFYKWLIQRADKMSAAMVAYLLPSSEKETLTVTEAANKFKVDPTDIVLLESVYTEMQKVEGEENE